MPRPDWNPEGRALWRLIWRDARWPVFIMAAHAGGGLLIDQLGVLPIRQAMIWNGQALLTVLVVSVLLLPLLLAADVLHVRSLRRAQRRYLTVRSGIGVLVVALFVAQESQMHEAFKRFIGRPANPFRWDAPLSRADTWLHFGQPAWRWLDLLFHPAYMTAALDTAYIGWFVLVLVLGCVIAWLPRRRLRRRALCCWGLLWVLLGTVLAQAFSSAGPVYYHHVVAGPDPFAPLLAHLDSVNSVTRLSAVQLHAAVWENLHRAHDLRWLHISAFPSLHVALPFFFALVFLRVWRPLGLILLAITAIILCGSVYLAWHYAIDGYISLLSVLALWWLAGRLTSCHRVTGATVSAPPPFRRPTS
jgi:hypothetical protein